MVPQTVNGHTVVAYVEFEASPNSGIVVVRRETGSSRTRRQTIDYVCWLVWYSHNDGKWLAEGGRYDLTYDDALSILAYRVGIVTHVASRLQGKYVPCENTWNGGK